jgi:hypothetical protein
MSTEKNCLCTSDTRPDLLKATTRKIESGRGNQKSMFGKRQGGVHGRTIAAGNVLRTPARTVLRFHPGIEFAVLFLVTFFPVTISSIAASKVRSETQYSSTPEYRAAGSGQVVCLRRRCLPQASWTDY